jgi:hypothetical protein
MKALTIRLTVMCEYCGCPMTYKKLANKEKAKEHLHGECRKLKNLGIKIEKFK